MFFYVIYDKTGIKLILDVRDSSCRLGRCGTLSCKRDTSNLLTCDTRTVEEVVAVDASVAVVGHPLPNSSFIRCPRHVGASRYSRRHPSERPQDVQQRHLVTPGVLLVRFCNTTQWLADDAQNTQCSSHLRKTRYNARRTSGILDPLDRSANISNHHSYDTRADNEGKRIAYRYDSLCSWASRAVSSHCSGCNNTPYVYSFLFYFTTLPRTLVVVIVVPRNDHETFHDVLQEDTVCLLYAFAAPRDGQLTRFKTRVAVIAFNAFVAVILLVAYAAHRTGYSTIATKTTVAFRTRRNTMMTHVMSACVARVRPLRKPATNLAVLTHV